MRPEDDQVTIHSTGYYSSGYIYTGQYRYKDIYRSLVQVRERVGH